MSTALSAFAIAPQALAAVIDACRAGYPAEVCGLIGEQEGTLLRAFPVPNVADPGPAGCGFLMESRGQLRAIRAMEEAGLELAGIYHSHPRSAAIPSEGDVHLAAYPETVNLIVSLLEPEEPELRAWRIAGGRPTELHLRVPGAVRSPAARRETNSHASDGR